MLEPFLESLQQERTRRNFSSTKRVPVLAKIFPDLEDERLERILAICRKWGIDGFVIANTTARREGLRSDPALLETFGFGGLSGRLLKLYVRHMLQKIFNWTGGELPIVAVGGIGCDSKVHPAEEVWQYSQPGCVAGGSVYRFYLPRTISAQYD